MQRQKGSYTRIGLCIKDLFGNEQSSIVTVSDCFGMMKPLHCKHSECETTERSYTSIGPWIEDLFGNEPACTATESNCFGMMKPFYCKHSQCQTTERSYANIELFI